MVRDTTRLATGFVASVAGETTAAGLWGAAQRHGRGGHQTDIPLGLSTHTCKVAAAAGVATGLGRMSLAEIFPTLFSLVQGWVMVPVEPLPRRLTAHPRPRPPACIPLNLAKSLTVVAWGLGGSGDPTLLVRILQAGLKCTAGRSFCRPHLAQCCYSAVQTLLMAHPPGEASDSCSASPPVHHGLA